MWLVATLLTTDLWRLQPEYPSAIGPSKDEAGTIRRSRGERQLVDASKYKVHLLVGGHGQEIILHAAVYVVDVDEDAHELLARAKASSDLEEATTECRC